LGWCGNCDYEIADPENYGKVETTYSSMATAGNQVTVINPATSPVPVTDETLAALVSSTQNVQAASGATVYATPFVGGSPVTSGNALPVRSTVSTMTATSGSATASGTTTIATPPANSNLRKLTLAIPGNAAQASAGNNAFSIALGGTIIFSEAPFIPATALSNAGDLYHRDLDFSAIAPNAGASGTLTATLANALTSGSLQINAYFD